MANTGAVVTIFLLGCLFVGIGVYIGIDTTVESGVDPATDFKNMLAGSFIVLGIVFFVGLVIGLVIAHVRR